MKLNTSIRKRFRVSNKVKRVASKDRFRLSISRSSKNISAQIIDDTKKITLLSASSVEKDLKSFSTDEADNKVTFFVSSMIWAEIFLADLDILNLNLSFGATLLTLLLTLNLFLIPVFNFITFSFPLF